MAWPIDAVYEVITAGVTTAKKTLADALQNAIIGLVGGNKSVRKFTVDGVGDVDRSAVPNGVALLNGDPSDDAVPCRQTTEIPGTRLLVNEYTIDGDTTIREYSDKTAATFAYSFLRTYNARWVAADSEWVSDDTGDDAILFMQNNAGLAVFGKAATASPWVDADWGYTTAGTADLSLDVSLGLSVPLDMIPARDVLAGRNVTASQDIAAGRYIGAQRFFPSGTALTSTEIVEAFFGDASTVNNIAGSDAAVRFRVNAADSGGGLGYQNPCAVTITFADGTWTTTPVAHVQLAFTTDPAANQSIVTWVTSATDIVINLATLPASGYTYDFVVTVTGV